MQVEAARCIGSIRDQVGARVFAGRLSESQQAALRSNANIPPPARQAAVSIASVGVPLTLLRQQQAAMMQQQQQVGHAAAHAPIPQS